MASVRLCIRAWIFLSTPSARRATTFQARKVQFQQHFYPRPPRGGRPSGYKKYFEKIKISIHALREEGDPQECSSDSCLLTFLSTPSARRATRAYCDVDRGKAISIHALREEGDDPPHRHRLAAPRISIHALREEGDALRTTKVDAVQDFYPRPPRGGRPPKLSASAPIFRFLSTPSARRATAKTETKSLFSNKLYNILHEFRRALIYNGSKSYPNHAK